MSGNANLTVTAIDRLTSLPVMANALAKPEAAVTNVAPGTANGSVDVKVSWANCEDVTGAKVIVKDKLGNTLKDFTINSDRGKNATTVTIQTLQANTDVDVIIIIFAGKKEIITSKPTSGKTK